MTLVALAALVVFWWRGNQQRRRVSMPLAEARQLLGLGADADADQVRDAHRRIIARVHPDAGGTIELARRTNLARDVLLKELARPSTD
ncbi:J domain-containing protein [Sphingomonas sp. MAH-20]|uniref:J domain-containing protein n=1 Tax=Sphingomonas horti TaxID=2682842 RepID=A0A6I4J4G6_9SPHN|nr:J domain-containing protein [Sphingomonas sp. CGMCC 1.13658]MVO78988.1 J domain-containing protein [Sphingomonas horti]